LNAYEVQIELLSIDKSNWLNPIDSTLRICSFLGLFQTPKYVGKGVIVNIIDEIFPRADKKSRTLSYLGTSLNTWDIPFETVL